MVEQRIQQPCDAQGITRSAPCRQFCPSDYFREIKDFVMTNFTRALVRILILICCLCICTLAMISFPQEGLKECVELSKKEYELLVRYHDETCSHQR